MALTPLDIHNKEFRRGFRGYAEDDVDEFLDQVIRDYEAVIKERDLLREQVDGANRRLEQYRQLESNLQKALVVAQSTAEEVRAAAKREAELTIKEAEMKAQQILERSQVREKEYTDRLQMLKQEMQMFRARVKTMLYAQVELLDAPLEDESRPLPARAEGEGASSA